MKSSILNTPNRSRKKHRHSVQFYENDDFLVTSVQDFFKSGTAAIVIATPAHIRQIEKGLTLGGMELAEARKQRLFQSFDAEETIARFMVDGKPDPDLFRASVGEIIQKATAARRGVRVFGEMVASLWERGNSEASIALEELWNALQAEYDFELFCAYPMQLFSRSAYADGFIRICDTHTIVTPVESYSGLSKSAREREVPILQQRLHGYEMEPSMLEAIVQSSDDAIVSKTLDGVIRSWNKGAEQIFGYTEKEAVGKHISLIIPKERLNEEKMILSKLRKGEKIDHFDTKRLRKDGKLVDISLTVSPVKNAKGEIIGASKIARDITDRKQHEAMLREEEHRKDEFLAVLAHELRNPLAPISLAAETLQLTDSKSEVAKESVGIIQRQVAHMVRLIDDLLDLSRIKSAKIELRREKLDLGEVMRAAMEMSQASVAEAGHRLIASFAPNAILVYGDRVRLVQVISNLLGNAARYTQPGGTIWLETAEKSTENVTITVRDTGIGIDAETLPRIFEMFMQGGHVVNGANRGLGIGLTLAKRIVEMHGGSIEAESPGPNLGSTFTVRLPILAQLSSDFWERPHVSRDPISSLRTLVVDDNKDARVALSTMLRRQGNTVAVASDGLEAVDAAQKFAPDLILMDIGMPNMNGYEAAKLIREQKLLRQPMLIAVTGLGQGTDKQLAQIAGFDAHLTKPIDSQKLASALASISVDKNQYAGLYEDRSKVI